MSKSRRDKKYIRLRRKIDKIVADDIERTASLRSRLDPEITERIRLSMQRRALTILTPGVIDSMKASMESLSRTSRGLASQWNRLGTLLRSQQEAEWKERNGNRPLPGGILMRSKRLRKKREAVLSYSPSL